MFFGRFNPFSYLIVAITLLRRVKNMLVEETVKMRILGRIWQRRINEKELIDNRYTVSQDSRIGTDVEICKFGS